jgi:uncharacterized alkaline shock family protein YloU
MDSAPVNGKIFIAPGVLITVAKLAALSVPGVVRMSPVPGGVNNLFRLGASRGVRLETHGDLVTAELFLVVQSDVSTREVAEKVQKDVSRAITEIVGLKVGQIVVHIEDIAPPPPED